MKKNKKINPVWIVLLVILILGAAFGYSQYRSWRQSFIVPPSMTEQGGIASDPLNYQLDTYQKIPIPK